MIFRVKGECCFNIGAAAAAAVSVSALLDS